MQEPEKTLDIEGVIVKIYQDQDAQNPEAMTDAPVYLAHFHRDLDHCSKDLPFDGRATFAEWHSEILAQETKPRSWGVWPLLSYIHGGVVLAIKGSVQGANFPDQQFDVSRCGWILIPRQEWVDYSGTPMEEVKWLEIAEAHVKEWNQYLSGDVHGYVIEIEGEENDSCWGFYGMDAVVEAATEAAKAIAARLREAKEAFDALVSACESTLDLDDMVHDAKSAEGSAINNEGAAAQVQYLLDSGTYTAETLAAAVNNAGRDS